MSRVRATTTAADRDNLSAWLDKIETHVRSGNRKELPWSLLRARGPLDLQEAQRAADVAEMLVGSGGTGVTAALESLLAAVASCPSEELVPFWERVMRPRHEFGRRDVTAATRAEIGGLALCSLAARGNGRVRDAMLRILPSLGARAGGSLLLQGAIAAETLRQSDLWMAAARRMAVEDREFEGRYLARCALRAAGIRGPVDSAAGRVSFGLRYLDFSCVIELASTASLAGLHSAIQQALRWDDDHAWCFYLNGRRRDSMFTWSDEEGLTMWPPPGLGYDAPGEADAREGPFDDEPGIHGAEPLEIQPEVVGELGLRAGNKLLYHFDFGDNHLIPLKVRKVDAAPRDIVARPSITGAKGNPPRQYG